MESLDDRLGHCAVFNVDALGGDVIGLKWRPGAFVPGPFKVSTAHTTMPCSNQGRPSGNYILNMSAVMLEIMQLGEAIVADIILCC
jgi:U3 small nucleolar RNA-associated protein 22